MLKTSSSSHNNTKMALAVAHCKGCTAATSSELGVADLPFQLLVHFVHFCGDDVIFTLVWT